MEEPFLMNMNDRPAHRRFLAALGFSVVLGLTGCATGPASPLGSEARATTPGAPSTLEAPAPAVRADAAVANPASPAASTSSATQATPANRSAAAAGAAPAGRDASSPAKGSDEPAATASDILAEPGDVPPKDDKADLWQRIRNGYALPDIEGELVTKWEQFYATRAAYMGRMTERGSRYLFHIVEEVDKRRMPLDLALLPFIESAFEPNAKSRVRASGLWQFMPATGRDFDLTQNLFRDDRRSVLDSTRAALDYLQFLHRKFGDWQLALAAYNWGQGNVQRAIDRAQRAGRPAAYEDLPMPAETRNYVPKLQAIRNIVREPQRFGLNLPPLQNHPYFLSVAVHRDIDVALVKRLAGVDADTFEQLNPQLNKPVILAAGTPQLLLPYDNAQRFVSALQQHQGPLASWTAWVAPRTLRPADAAKQVGMSEAQLREVNRIPPRMLVRVGSTLLVPRSSGRQTDVSEKVADSAQLALAPEARKRARSPAAKGKARPRASASAQRPQAKRSAATASARAGTAAPKRPTVKQPSAQRAAAAR
jgi:membrane-bound lytic murein transglycosylase D